MKTQVQTENAIITLDQLQFKGTHGTKSHEH